MYNTPMYNIMPKNAKSIKWYQEISAICLEIKYNIVPIIVAAIKCNETEKTGLEPVILYA